MATIVTFRSSDVLHKHPAAAFYRSVNFAPHVAEAESLSGVPTATPEDGSGLTVSEVSIVGDAVQFKLTGGTPRATAWLITVTVPVTGGPGAQTFVAEVFLLVSQWGA